MGTSTGTAPWWLRVIFVALGVAAWLWTQSLIAQRPLTTDSAKLVGDVLLDALEGTNQYLEAHRGGITDWLLIVSSSVINVLAFLMLGQAIFGPSIRPFLSLLLVFGMRQICQALCTLPAPTGFIWYEPGFPGLLVTYEVACDFFFSGHTSLAVLGAIELARLGKGWIPVAILIVVFESVTVLALRVHYTMDVFTGIVAACCAATLGERWSPWCDRMLARIVPSRASSVAE
jgi:hypothetical protein